MESKQHKVGSILLFSTVLGFVSFFGLFVRAQDSASLRTAENKYSDGFVITLYDAQRRDQQFDQILASISSSQIRHLSFGVIATQDTKYSNVVNPDTVQNQWVLTRVARLKRLGYTTSLIPILFGTQDNSWRGHFEPQNSGAWLRSYSDWILNMARMAESAGVSEFSVASEMNQLYRLNESGFIDLMNRVRRVFTGPTFVTLNSLSDVPVALIRSGDFVSVSAYVALRQGWISTSCENLMLSYVIELTTLSFRVNRPIHVTEIGYPSVQNGMSEPWNFAAITDPRTAVSESEQSCGYKSIVSAMGHNRRIHRIQLWELSDASAPEHPKSYSPVGKLAWDQVNNLIRARTQLRR